MLDAERVCYFDPAYLAVIDRPLLSQEWGYPGHVDTIQEQIHFSPQPAASLEADITYEEYLVRNILYIPTALSLCL